MGLAVEGSAVVATLGTYLNLQAQRHIRRRNTREPNNGPKVFLWALDLHPCCILLMWALTSYMVHLQCIRVPD